jgi:tripartite-type tricarboxylate transporter receptor subunit TctC
MIRSILHCCTAALLWLPAAAWSQAYPTRYISLVTGFTAGGGVDLIARTYAVELAKVLGQQVIVENRPGAGGTVGADFVAKAKPDGYTLLVGGPGNNAIAYSVYPNLPYQPNSFAPVSLLSQNPNVIAIHPSVPADSIADLVRIAKAKPGGLRYGTPGNGSGQHLAAELFKMTMGIDLQHVPYRGVPESNNALLVGEIEMALPPVFQAAALAKAGKIKALAVTTPQRSSAMPSVPSMQEAGVADFDQTVWNALFAPAGTPPAIIARLNEAVVQTTKLPQLVSRLESLGAAPASSTSSELGERVQKEIVRWGRVVKATGAKPD